MLQYFVPYNSRDRIKKRLVMNFFAFFYSYLFIFDMYNITIPIFSSITFNVTQKTNFNKLISNLIKIYSYHN